MSAPEAFFTKHREFTIDKARHVLGYQPQAPLEEGIRRTAEWYVQDGHLPEVTLPAAGGAVASGLR